MKTAKALKPFNDLTEGVLREIGDSFIVEDSRGEYLASIGLVEVSDLAEKPKRRAKKGED